MSAFNILIEVGDAAGTRYVEAEALVDTGSSYTTLPGHMLVDLGVQPIGHQRFVLANGQEVSMDIGQTRVRVDGHERITVVVFGDEAAHPLLGAVTLEEMGLGVDPLNQRLIEVPGWLAGYRL